MSRRYVNFYFLLEQTAGSKKTINMHQISKDADMTVSHMSNVTDQLEKEGLIVKHRKGRECSLEITEAGKEFGEILRKFNELANKQLNLKKQEDGN